MSSSVRVLVVGLGNMGASHASACHRNSGSEIDGLVGRTTKTKGIPEELDGYPPFDNYEEALADTQADAVSINTWVNAHADFAIKAITEDLDLTDSLRQGEN